MTAGQPPEEGGAQLGTQHATGCQTMDRPALGCMCRGFSGMPYYNPAPPTAFYMTLRDYFAGQALQGIIASPHTHYFEDERKCQPIEYPLLAYQYADEMLIARDVE